MKFTRILDKFDGFIASIISTGGTVKVHSLLCLVSLIEMEKFILLFLFYITLLRSMSGIECSQESVDLENPIVFYDLKTRDPLQPPITRIIPGSENETFNMSSVINIRLPFIGQPCSCESFTCSCCAGMMIEQFNFDQKMCMSMTYDPMEFALIMDMNMNENSIYSNMVSGRDPPPLCLPIPTGPLPLGMDMCIKMFNIFTPGYNLHLCMDIMARVQMSEIMILHFDCMRFGQDSIAFLKPEDNGGLMEVTGGEAGEGESGGESMVFYDPVHDDKKNKTMLKP